MQKATALYCGVWDVTAEHLTGNGTAIYTDPSHPIVSYEGCFVNAEDSATCKAYGNAGLYDGHGRMV
jgi:hypothetical protein